MKQIFKKSNIFSFLLGALIFTGITSVAAYTILAKDIEYTPSDSTWKKSNGEDITNVKDAIDELYVSASQPLVSKIDFSTFKTHYMGNRQSGNKLSISLTKGDYIISAVNSHAWASPSLFNLKNDIDSNSTSWINPTNGSCELLTGYYVEPTATNKTDDVKYVSQYTYSILYKCSFTDDGKVELVTSDGNYADCTQGVILQALKLD